MEKEVTDLELIENFLEKKLSSDEAVQFEERLKQDVEFSALFNDLKWIIPGIEQSSRNALKKEIAGFANDLSPFSASEAISSIDLEKDFGVKIAQNHLKISTKNDKQTSTFFNIRYGIAATLSLILVATFIFLNRANPEEAYQLAYNDIGEGPYTFLADSESPVPLNRGSVTQKSLDAEQQAYQNYQAFEFENALNNFEIAKPELGQQNPKLLFYLGNTYLALDKPKEAIDSFNELLALPKNLNETYVSKTKWYLGLSHLKNGDLDSAKEVFTDLQKNTSDSYKEKAQQALNQIKWGLF